MFIYTSTLVKNAIHWLAALFLVLFFGFVFLFSFLNFHAQFVLRKRYFRLQLFVAAQNDLLQMCKPQHVCRYLSERKRVISSVWNTQELRVPLVVQQKMHHRGPFSLISVFDFSFTFTLFPHAADSSRSVLNVSNHCLNMFELFSLILCISPFCSRGSLFSDVIFGNWYFGLKPS